VKRLGFTQGTGFGGYGEGLRIGAWGSRCMT
jgi:hypothetical protein